MNICKNTPREMFRFIAKLIFLGGLGISFFAQSAVLQRGSEVIVEGEITFSDVTEFYAALNKNNVNHVIFRNSGGGKFQAGLEIGIYLSTKKLPSEIEGICASACALAFLGGEVRTFSKKVLDSAFMLHPRHNVLTYLTSNDAG